MLGAAGYGDRALRLPLWETLRQAWADPELRSKITFVLLMFAVFAFGVSVRVPIPGVSAADIDKMLSGNQFLQLLNALGGGAIRRVSIFSLGLNPYITSSIIMQILTSSIPQWKQELKEGGEYARKQQNRRTRVLTLILCVLQGLGLLNLMQGIVPNNFFAKATILTFWTAGAMFMLWMGEQISEKGIGNGVSLMIFAGIIISLPSQSAAIGQELQSGFIAWWQILILLLLFVGMTWLVVLFTIAQRRIPIQHMRRQAVGQRMSGGQTSYLPFSLNLAGVIPIIFAISLVQIPSQIESWFRGNQAVADIVGSIAKWLSPGPTFPEGVVGCLFYTILIFFFTYFYTAIQYSVEDIADHLKRAGSFIPGVRPGKQTKDFLDGVISRITVIGAVFLSAIALMQFLSPALTGISRVAYFLGTSLLIMVSVALDTMRQIEANILMRQYGN